MELLRHVLGTPDLVPGDVEGEELAVASRLDLDQFLRIVLLVKGTHVETEAITDGLCHPFDLPRKVISSLGAQPVSLNLQHELLPQFCQVTVGCIPFCEVNTASFS